jgi:peptide deformylase
MANAESPIRQASAAFVAEFARWRLERGLSKKQLAAAMGFDPSYLSHVEAHRHRPTEDFARRAETVLQAGGEIWRRFREYDDLRTNARGRAAPGPQRDPPVLEPWLPPGSGLVVERETARLSYVNGRYRCTIQRALYNGGTEPVARYLIRIAVDRYPDESERSNAHHRTNPLSWDELRLVASCAAQPMEWRPKTDRDAFKEAWLLFENAHARFPLYPGQRTTIQYSYHVGADKWGRWFQRAVRLPTRRLRIELDLPMSMRPVVWGMETTLSAESIPLRTPIEQEIDGDRAVFSWSTENPPLHARYRLEWRFRGQPLPDQREAPGAGPTDNRPDRSRYRIEPPGTRMAAAGIVQRGAAVLRVPGRRLDLPREADVAVDAVDQLNRVLQQISTLHTFRKGFGLAAPQLGMSVAVAVVRPAGERAPVVLLNPRIVDASPEQDEQFEGCLSFFDVRGTVRRPLRITVESTLPTGERIHSTYEHALARLVAHEIDHLAGRLYTDRMARDAPLVPLGEYDQTGLPWVY